MAGYNWYAGKSNNAVDAEREGKMVATKFAAWCRSAGIKGCTAADVAAVLSPCEWHHTSKFFNRVNYFDPAEFADDDRADLQSHIADRKAKAQLWRQTGLSDLEKLGAYVRDHRELMGAIMIDAGWQRCKAPPATVLAATRRLIAAGVEVIISLPQLRRCYRRTAAGWIAA